MGTKLKISKRLSRFFDVDGINGAYIAKVNDGSISIIFSKKNPNSKYENYDYSIPSHIVEKVSYISAKINADTKKEEMEKLYKEVTKNEAQIRAAILNHAKSILEGANP